MENNQQYLNPETYVGVIQELSNTISNLHIELALAKTQHKEALDYIQELQDRINRMSEPVETMSGEVVGADINE